MELESLAAQFSLYREISDSQIKKSDGGLSSSATPSSNEDAIVSHIADSSFSQKLYKHLSDYYSGQGNLSKDTNRQLAKKDNNIANQLNQDDPSASALYSGYRTAGFAYSSKARFITGLDSTVKLASDIKRIYSTKA